MRAIRARHVAVLAVALLGLPLSACGEDGAGSAELGDPPAAVTAEPEATPDLPARHRNPDGSDVVVDDVSRIVVLNGDIAEVVYALELGDEVVATDSSATYPPEAVAKQSIGYQRSLSAEGILSKSPSVVIGTTDAGPPTVLTQIAAAGVPVVILTAEHDLDAPATKVASVAAALGVPGRGAVIVDEIEAAMARVEADREDVPPTKLAVLYLRGTNTQLAFGEDTAGHAIAEAVGVEPAFDVQGSVPLTPEALIAAQPDVLVLTDGGLESVGGIDGLLKIPGIAQTPAGRDRRVLHFDDQLLLGMGPRWPSVLETLIDELTGA
ncbi:MAG: hemin ABC transporter substrate-binding protein [Acidimicrobiia bacterium]